MVIFYPFVVLFDLYDHCLRYFCTGDTSYVCCNNNITEYIVLWSYGKSTWFQVISLKETQLIGHVAMDIGVSGKDSCQQVRFISPKYGGDDVLNKSDSICTDLTKSGENEVPESPDCEVNLPMDCQPNFEVSTGIVTSNDDNIISSLKDRSSCKDFLEHVDRQLRVVEIDLVEFIRLQSLKIENRQEQMNNKVQQISELLTEILSIRGR